MSPELCKTLVIELSTLLVEKNLEWILVDVDEVLRNGNLIEKSVSLTPTSKGGELVPTKSRAVHLGSEEYSPSQVLEILLSAIDRVLVDTAEIEVEIFDKLKAIGSSVSDITFLRPASAIGDVSTFMKAGGQPSRTISPTVADKRRESAEKLRIAIKALIVMATVDVQ